MRLVDADKQLESVDRMIPEDKIAQEVAFSVDSVRDYIINAAPSIDAIPVEWLARRVKCYMDSYYAGHTVDLHTAAILRDTVVAWHKEQKTQ